MKKILFILLSFGLAGEMEVDGDLKVTGTVDANGNPITNVGAPQTMSDAVNAGTLASSLGIGIIYEYISYKVKVQAWNSDGYNWWVLNNHLDEGSWNTNFMDELNTKASEGFEMHSIIPLPNVANVASDYDYLLFFLRRPISDD